jgi:DNA-binding CsgD family transcriptional regulator
VWLGDAPSVWVGRQREVRVLQAAADRVGGGEGSVIWVEGEPGIGKTALVATGVEVARRAGWNVFWGSADQLSQRLPLRVVLDCLQIRHDSPDRRRAAIADYLRHHRPGLFAADDVVYVAAEMLLALVDELSAASPTVIVIDDLHWADEASLTVWHRLALAVSQLPLLLIGTCYQAPRGPSMQELRATVLRRGGTVVSVGPLDEAEVAALVAGMVGGAPQGSIVPLLASAMGNPLYLRELIVALGRERILAAGSAKTDTSADMLTRIPPSFTAALSDRLSLMPASTMEMLRAATLLGREFAVTDLAVILRRSAFELTVEVQDAMAAGIIAAIDMRLAFRHPLIRIVLYDSMPLAMRAALHQDAAHSLALANAEPLVVAQQLLAAGRPGGGWARRWLIDAAPALAARAPELTAELLQRELDHAQVHDREWAWLSVALARMLLELGRNAEGVMRARQALVVAVEPASRAEIQWLLARSLSGMGSNEEALETVRRALQQAEVPAVWRARLLASAAMFQRASTGDLDGADSTAQQALQAGEEVADTFAIAYALVSLWLSNSVRRDHVTALDCIDRALGALGDGADHADLRTFILDGRIFTMQNLDRWPDAEATLLRARALAQRHDPGNATSSVTAAVLMYWLGRWDDALAELSAVNENLADVTYSGLRERGPALLWHGVAALIAARRGDRQLAAHSLSVGLALPVRTAADRENSDFLTVAQALVAEQNGDPLRALPILSTLLERPAGEMTLVHQWLPDIVRLALAVGDHQVALSALRTCQAEAEAESKPARATAASSRCAGLFHGAPAELRQAVAHYRAAGPAVDLAGALEDLAVVLAGCGSADEARNVLNEAVDGYENLGAAWDIGRAERRLRVLGIRRGVHGPRPRRAASGWEALTPTELKIAYQIAQGQSTPKIAHDMFLSRRTVQTHISHILNKIGAQSRVEIAREAFRRGTDGMLWEAHLLPDPGIMAGSALVLLSMGIDELGSPRLRTPEARAGPAWHRLRNRPIRRQGAEDDSQIAQRQEARDGHGGRSARGRGGRLHGGLRALRLAANPRHGGLAREYGHPGVQPVRRHRGRIQHGRDRTHLRAAYPV